MMIVSHVSLKTINRDNISSSDYTLVVNLGRNSYVANQGRA